MRAPARRDGLSGQLLFGDRYLKAMAFCLLGYAIIGKGFAYIGVPPLYIGEVTLLFGLLALSRTGCVLSTFSSLPNLVLLVLCCWTVARTVPFITVYGVDAVRDSVTVLYGIFAFILCSLLVERPERVGQLLRYYGRFAAVFGAIASTLYVTVGVLVSRGMMPAWPSSGVPIVFIRPGEVAVHLAGCSVFALLFFRRTNWLWICALMSGIGIIAAQSRGGLLAIMLPLCLAAAVSGRTREVSKVLVFVFVVVSLGYAFNLEVPLNDRDRTIGVRQIVENAVSIVGDSGEADLDGTKMWRLAWWDEIIRYTFHGPYFWTGKGFGIALAEADGFGGTTGDAAVLRSPHNVTMTMLARAGVPGLVLWVGLLLVWFGHMALGMLRARLRGDTHWANLFLFLGCYVLSAIINASFDVALEGPMMGIWFWVLFGCGTGCGVIYRAIRVSAAPLRVTQPSPVPVLARGGGTMRLR